MTDDAIRPARRSDLPAVQETLVASWRTGYDGILDAEALDAATADPDEFYPPERFERKLDDDRLRVLVATPDDHDRPRGIATVNWGPDNTQAFVPEGDGQLRSVYVHPDWWGAGVGTALVEAGLGALPASVGHAWVECLADNDRGIEFYRSRGFEAVDRRRIELFGETHPTRVFRRELAVDEGDYSSSDSAVTNS